VVTASQQTQNRPTDCLPVDCPLRFHMRVLRCSEPFALCCMLVDRPFALFLFFRFFTVTGISLQ
jgi:hypothetical protein